MKQRIKDILSGISQTFFVGDFRHGAILVFLLVLFAPVATAVGLLSALATSLIGEGLKPSRAISESGLFALNGFFMGFGLASLFQITAAAVVWWGLGAALTAVATLFFHRLFQNWQFPLLVFPFMAAFQMIWLTKELSAGLVLIHAVAVPEPSGIAAAWVVATLNSFGQIFFHPRPELGAAVLALLFFTRLRLGASAVLGATAANSLAALVGVPDGAWLLGVWGFNGALAAIALGHGFSGLDRGRALAGSLLSVVLYAAAQRIMTPLGLLPMGLPYVGAVWIFLTVAQRQAKPVSVPFLGWSPAGGRADKSPINSVPVSYLF